MATIVHSYTDMLLFFLINIFFHSCSEQMDASMLNPLYDTFRIDNSAPQQSDNIIYVSLSSEDADADIDELFRVTNVNYQCKIYTDSFISIRGACEVVDSCL